MRKKYEVWLADLDPAYGAEPGKVRPVVVVQNNSLNNRLKSTMICPTTSKLLQGTSILRLRLGAGEAGLSVDSDVLVSQVRAIDNLRFQKKLGTISSANQQALDENLAIVLDLI